MKKTSIVLVTISLFAVLILGAFLIDRGMTSLNQTADAEPANDPIDVTIELANSWLENLTATTSISLPEFLETGFAIAEALEQQLIDRAANNPELDVLLCQANPPARIGVKPVYETADTAQVMIIPRGGEKTSNQTIVTLSLQNQSWVIMDLTCSTGEVGGPVGEYSFEHAGQLIQASIPEPYDPAFWHIVFTRDGVDGNVAQLLFDEESMCSSAGQENVCDPGTFTETAAVFVQADMLEAGALVRRMEVR